MNNSQQPLDDKARQRQLEALFADDPWLSPTMKARRLHERLQESRPPEIAAVEEIAQRSAVPFRIAGPPDAEISRPRVKAGSKTRISFTEAVACLRRPHAPLLEAIAPTDRLRHFRTQVLTEWLQQVGQREIG